jgi:hypothetical protein
MNQRIIAPMVPARITVNTLTPPSRSCRSAVMASAALMASTPKAASREAAGRRVDSGTPTAWQGRLHRAIPPSRPRARPATMGLMTDEAFKLSVIQGSWAVVRLAPDGAIPAWAMKAPGFVSITRTADELSIICAEAMVPPELEADRQWPLLKLQGPIPLTKSGVLLPIATPLSSAGITILVLSTFDTDYFLVRKNQLSMACQALVTAGHECLP